MITNIYINLNYSVKEGTLHQNGEICERKDSSRGGIYRPWDSNCLSNNSTINPIPGVASFTPHFPISLSAAVTASIDKSLPKLVERSDHSISSETEINDQSKSTQSIDKVGSTILSKQAAIKAVTAIPFSSSNNDNITNVPHCTETPTKVWIQK